MTLTIRGEQQAVLEEAQRHWFALEMVDHLHQYAPAHAARIGDSMLYRVARMGLDKAEQYGFTMRGPVRLFIELMVLLGTYFDTDPQYFWAANILNGRREQGEMKRADLLQEQAVRFYDSVLGSDYRYEHAAIRRLCDEHFTNIPDLDSAANAEILLRFQSVYPEKVAHVGQAALDALVTHARLLALDYSLTTPFGVALIAGLTFALGYRCDVDPQFPWIATCLSSPDTHGSLQRPTRLRQEFAVLFGYRWPRSLRP